MGFQLRSRDGEEHFIVPRDDSAVRGPRAGAATRTSQISTWRFREMIVDTEHAYALRILRDGADRLHLVWARFRGHLDGPDISVAVHV
jgi:hypothetical protein